MKVLRLHGIRNLKLHEESVPEPDLGEVLLQIRAVGICGSDLHWLQECCIGAEKVKDPVVLGHEFSGLVEDTNQLVAVDPAINCRVCAHCCEGNANFCCVLRFAGNPDQDGALREYLAWPEYLLHQLPDSFTAEDGVMLEPLGVALHALDLAHGFPGMKIAVIGCGPIGLLVVQLARLAGASEILATDPLPHRLEVAREMGATRTFATSGTEVDEILSHIGEGVDIAVEAAGDNEAVEVAIGTARPGARVVLIGIPPDDRISFRSSVARRNGLTIKLVRRMRHTYPRAIELVEKGLIDVRSLVTHRFPLERFEEAFEVASRREGLKVIVEP